jgi:predicted transcriptional regulator
LDWYLEELKSPSEETKKMEDKFFEELEEVEQEYDEVFQEAKNIVGID